MNCGMHGGVCVGTHLPEELEVNVRVHHVSVLSQLLFDCD